MKAADARAMTVDQLDDEVLKLKKEQFNLRFQRATGQLENTARVREVRRDIARIKTDRRAEARREPKAMKEKRRCRSACCRASSSATSRTRPWSCGSSAASPIRCMKKTVRRSKKYHAHDENNEFKVGDIVWIEETGRSPSSSAGSSIAAARRRKRRERACARELEERG